MAAFTTAHFYRPGPPPIVTMEQLAYFMGTIADVGLISNFKPTVKAKFGARIDSDDLPTTITVPLNDLMDEERDIDWDVDKEFPNLLDAINFMRKRGNRTIYRSWVTLGDLSKDVIDVIDHPALEKGGNALWLDTVGLELAPIIVNTNDDKEFHVGWMSVNLSGYGYLYPWTHDELRTRIAGQSKLCQIGQLCRSFWPVPLEYPSPETVSLRKEMGQLWGSDLEAPKDWRWVFAESF